MSSLQFSTVCLFCLTLLLSPLAAAPTVPAPAQSPAAVAPLNSSRSREGEIRGIWIHTYEAWDWETVMRKIAAAGFNCVFVRVARGVNAIYPSQYLPRDVWAEKENLDELQRAVDAAHRNGLEFHAWKVNFNAAAGPKNPVGSSVRTFYDKMAAEDRLARDPNGQQAAFLNPGDPRNTELEFNVMLEMVTKYNVDGVHFDYIRYTEVPHYDFDYGAVSRVEFEKAVGRPVVNWPGDVYSGPDKMAYEDWERENVNRLVQRVYEEVKKVKPQIKVSAAVWRKHRRYRAAIKQDWLKWVREGWLDFVCPMDYTPEHEDFRGDVRAQVANTAGHIPLAAGIGSYMQKTPEDVLKQIEIARSEGADGYVLFDYKREGMDALLDALAKGPHATPTYPAYYFPLRHGGWHLDNVIERKDDIPAAAAKVHLTAKLNTLWKGDVKRASATVLLEDRADTPLQRLGQTAITELFPCGDLTGHYEFEVPVGRSRITLRGTMQTYEGKSQPFVVRGPIIEGLPPDKIAALRTRAVPPNPVGPGRRVAIYNDGMAASGLLKALQGVPGVNVYPIYHLQPDHWQSAQVLILPQLNDVADITPAVLAALRGWVQKGGRLILTHDAVGYRWHPRLFPEVGRGSGASKQKQMEVPPNQWGLSPGTFEHAYVDHIVLQPAPGATVLAREAAAPVQTAPAPDATAATPSGAPPAGEVVPQAEAKPGAPVVIAGKFGQGTVIMYGALLGYMPTGAMPEGERRLLLELVTRP